MAMRWGVCLKNIKSKRVVTGGQKCASSCAIAFLGGTFRTMNFDAELLFHAPYLNKGVAIDCSDRGQVAGLLKYYKQMLGNKEGSYLLERTMSYCSATEGWTLNSGGAELFNIGNRLSLIPYRVQDEHQDNLVLNGCASDNTAMGYQRLYLETLAFENLR